MSAKAVWKGDVNQTLCAFTFDDGSSELPLELWLEHLKNPLQEVGVSENRELLTLRQFDGSYWGYVRAGVTEDTLVLLDYADKEAQADTLVYLLRWAAKTSMKLGLTRVEARLDIRKMNEMCRQLG